MVLNDERKNDESVVVSNQACGEHKTGSSEPTVDGTCISDSYVSINASNALCNVSLMLTVRSVN